MSEKRQNKGEDSPENLALAEKIMEFFADRESLQEQGKVSPPFREGAKSIVRSMRGENH